MISKKTKYGLKALFYLARQSSLEKACFISDIAKEEKIPKKFLELILLELKNKGILESYRGKAGGYCLRKNPRDIYVGEVMRILEGPVAPLPCLSKTAYRKCDECKHEDVCEIRIAFQTAYESTSAILDQTSLLDAIEESQQASQAKRKVLTYEI